MSRAALGPTQPPIRWVTGALSLGVKRSGREADHSPPSSAEVKKREAIHPFPNMPSWRGAQLKHRDNFTCTFISEMLDVLVEICTKDLIIHDIHIYTYTYIYIYIYTHTHVRTYTHTHSLALNYVSYKD
jgi:hypothetical protein